MADVKARNISLALTSYEKFKKAVKSRLDLLGFYIHFLKKKLLFFFIVEKTTRKYVVGPYVIRLWV